MLRQKILWTVAVLMLVIASAITLDYILNVLFLHSPSQFTPFVTSVISTAVGAPVTFVIINGMLDIRRARDELANAHRAAEHARATAQEALREAERSRQIALLERQSALQANTAKSEFLANMSHELRTPLNAVLGFAEMLQSGIRQDRAGEYAQLIYASGRHLLSLINDILDLSKIEAGKCELQPERVSIPLLVRDCLSLVRPAADKGEIVLRAELPCSLPELQADRRSLRQILLNLLTNSVKFTRPRGSVSIGASACDTGEVVLEVTDTGVGIAEEDMGRVFESFGQGRHDVVNGQGTGLGLPIVRGLVEAHGGRVTLESAVGRGTTVKVYLPAWGVCGLSRQVA